MKLLFDQNISHRILRQLSERYQGSATVKSEQLINCSDREIWDFAKKNDFTIVTQDSDFNDLNALFGFPPKIIWIRAGNIRTTELAKILDEFAAEIQVFEGDVNLGCLEILSLQK
jgi:predicted nuclease of predicted toxin-antitoxin system